MCLLLRMLKAEHGQRMFTKCLSKALTMLKTASHRVGARHAPRVRSKGFVSTCRPTPHTPVCLRQGFVMRLADGRLVFVVPVPAAYIADLPEAANVLNVLCYPARFSDPNQLVPKEELNSVRGVFTERTEEYHNQASQHRASSIRRLRGLAPRASSCARIASHFMLRR